MDSLRDWDKFYRETRGLPKTAPAGGQERLVRRPQADQMSEPSRQAPYDPARSAAAIRAGAETRYHLIEPIDAAADAVEQGIYRLSRINAILSVGPVDPAMIELKEEYQRGLLYRLQRFMRPDSGVAEDSLTIETTRRKRQY